MKQNNQDHTTKVGIAHYDSNGHRETKHKTNKTLSKHFTSSKPKQLNKLDQQIEQFILNYRNTHSLAYWYYFNDDFGSNNETIDPKQQLLNDTLEKIRWIRVTTFNIFNRHNNLFDNIYSYVQTNYDELFNAQRLAQIRNSINDILGNNNINVSGTNLNAIEFLLSAQTGVIWKTKTLEADEQKYYNYLWLNRIQKENAKLALLASIEQEKIIDTNEGSDDIETSEDEENNANNKIADGVSESSFLSHASIVFRNYWQNKVGLNSKNGNATKFLLSGFDTINYWFFLLDEEGITKLSNKAYGTTLTYINPDAPNFTLSLKDLYDGYCFPITLNVKQDSKNFYLVCLPKNTYNYYHFYLSLDEFEQNYLKTLLLDNSQEQDTSSLIFCAINNYYTKFNAVLYQPQFYLLHNDLIMQKNYFSTLYNDAKIVNQMLFYHNFDDDAIYLSWQKPFDPTISTQVLDLISKNAGFSYQLNTKDKTTLFTFLNKEHHDILVSKNNGVVAIDKSVIDQARIYSKQKEFIPMELINYKLSPNLALLTNKEIKKEKKTSKSKNQNNKQKQYTKSLNRVGISVENQQENKESKPKGLKKGVKL